MTDVSTLNPTAIRVTTVGIQGISGPPGANGPGSSVFIKFPEAETIPLVPSSAYAFTIKGLRGLKVTSGSLSISIRINDIDVTGLADIVVTSTSQDIALDEPTAVAIGDRVTLVIAGISSAANLEFTMS